MNKRPPSRALWRTLALFWLLIVLAAIGHNVWLWGGDNATIDTDILALLPRDERDPIAEAALERMAEAGEKRVVVLIGGATPESARRAADAYAARLKGLPLDLTFRVDERQMGEWKDFFARHRTQLLSPAHVRRIHTQDSESWKQDALQHLISPAPAAGLGWREDPFGFFNSWLLDQAQNQRVRIVDNRLWLVAEGREWAVLTLALHHSPLATATQERMLPALARAKAAALHAAPGVEVLEAGVLQFAASASSHAQAEMSIIGIGSTIGLIALVLLVFRRIRPLVLALTPIAVGTLAAVSVTHLVYGQIHALTLVFGASLIGVAEDYGIHYLSMGYHEKRFEPFERMQNLFGSLFLAMLTTVVAYGGLAFTPFPGLRQMALFAGAGLIAAWLSSVLWLPWFTRPLPPLAGIGRRIAASRSFWAGLLQGKRSKILLALAGLLLLPGLGLAVFKDDLRLLQNAPPALMQQQARIARLLALPSPAQFYVVRGASIEETLRREEALTETLNDHVAAGVIGAYQAVSLQVPSLAQQSASQNALRDLHAQTLPALAQQVGADRHWIARLNRTVEPLQIAAWQQHPASEPWRHLWLGEFDGQFASVVTLSGLDNRASLAKLAAIKLPGVRWVDKPAQISELMGYYRNMMTAVIVASLVIVYGLLRRRYGAAAWRGIAPTAAGMLLTVAVLGWIGEPVQLFTILALFLVLGMGVDYGIFMLEHPEADDGPSWLAVTMAAITTLLAFGLLAFSRTPALHAFGLATLIGIGASWLLAPAFQSPDLLKGKK